MSGLRKNKNYYYFLLFLGAILILVQWLFYSNEGNSTLGSVGIGILVVSVINIIRFKKLEKDPQRMKAFEISNSEERVIFLSEKARSYMFFIIICIEFVALIVFALLKEFNISFIVSMVLCAQILGFSICYWWLSKKY